MTENEWVTGNAVLKIGDIRVDFGMKVPANPVKPHRMLPIFQQMANSFTEFGVQAVAAEGKSISCKAGCGACCRQPVPISELEVYQIAELVESMPEPRRSVVKKRFADAVDHFRNNGMIDLMVQQYDHGRRKTWRKQMDEAKGGVAKYFQEGIPCPFLEDESCSIHANRPIVCREYLVTTPAANCAQRPAGTIDLVKLPIKPSKTVKHLGSTGRMKDEGILLLIRALELADQYPENFEEKTGKEWMADFFDRLSDSEARRRVQPPPASSSGKRKRRKRRT
jgi:Fe-S-cluster containining protein